MSQHDARGAWMIAAALAVSTLIACGAAPRAARGGPDAALAAYRAGDLGGARALAEGASDPVSLEIAARSALAMGDSEAALRATEGRREEPLIRLRAATLTSRDQHAAAASLLLSLPQGEDDPWAHALDAMGSANDGRALFAREGAASAVLPLDPELALPVVRVRIETREVRALIATSVHTTVLSETVRAEPAGVIDEIALGALRVRVVPYLARDLSVISEALGVEIDAVLGVDLLARLGATLDGPGQRLVVGEAARDAEPIESARFEGAFLAVRAGLDSHRSWLALDSTGAFAIALSPSGAERLAPTSEASTLELGPSVRIEGVPRSEGVVDDALAEATGAPIDGVIGWALLSELVLTLDGARVRVALPSR